MYNTKIGESHTNYLSVLDINTRTYYKNIYTLKFNDNNMIKNFERIGLKCVLVTKDELKPQRILSDYYNLLVFGGNTLEGIPTKE